MAAYRFCYKAIGVHRHFPPKIIISQGWPDVPDGTLCDVTPEPGCTYTRHTWPPRGRGRGESLTSARRLQAKFRALEVVRLRFAGHTWQDIAIAQGFKDASGAWRAARRLYNRLDLNSARRAMKDKQRN